MCDMLSLPAFEALWPRGVVLAVCLAREREAALILALTGA